VPLTEQQTATADTHDVIDPAILYLGTPVVLISSENPDGSTNLAPMSSAWWLGNLGVLGLASRSQTTRNILRTGECVLNLPSADQVDAVDRLALTTGANPMSDFKKANGYRYEPDKLGTAGLTPAHSITVRPERVAECPVNLEAALVAAHPLGGDDPQARGSALTIEVRVTAVHVHPGIRLAGHASRIDPDRWRPLIMSFQHFYGLGPELRPSTLATIPEESYR
jgi:flavin reductase (DIM6/NTAB) family NADH-FMN oxidoreductase RutF